MDKDFRQFHGIAVFWKVVYVKGPGERVGSNPWRFYCDYAHLRSIWIANPSGNAGTIVIRCVHWIRNNEVLYIRLCQNTWVQKRGPIAIVIVIQNPCGFPICDDSWLLLSLLSCLFNQGLFGEDQGVLTGFWKTPGCHVCKLPGSLDHRQDSIQSYQAILAAGTQQGH